MKKKSTLVSFNHGRDEKVFEHNIKYIKSQYIKSQDEHLRAFYRAYKRILRKVIRADTTYDVGQALRSSENFPKSAWKVISNSSRYQNPTNQLN